MRGFEIMRRSINLIRMKKKSTGTHLRGTGGNCSDKRKAVEDVLGACGEPEAENYKRVRAK